MTAPIAVLGGGPSGLACALALARRGERVALFDREPHPGGLCATHERDGHRFDLGGHRLVTADRALVAEARALLGDDLLERERRSVVLSRGRAFAYPLDAADLLANLGPLDNLAALASYAAEQAGRALFASPDRTFEQWVTARFGRRLYDRFFGPYTHKLWGLHPSLISADWASQRIGLLHLGDAALRLAGLNDAPVRTYARRYLYPRLGMGQLFSAMARELARLGGRLFTGAEIVRLSTSRGVVTHVHADTHEGPLTVPCRAVYATLSLPLLARLVDAPPPAALAASRLRFRGLRFVNLLLDRGPVSPFTWMYVADPELCVSRIQEPSHRSPSMTPPGRGSLMLEVPCDPGDHLFEAPDDALAARCLDELAKLGVAHGAVRSYFTVRAAQGYPVYHLGYDDDRRAVLSHLSRFGNLLVGGRQGLFRYIFVDTAMQMGREAARQLAAGHLDQRAIDAFGRERELLEARAHCQA